MTLKEKILTFINEMDYFNNKHVLGILFYGSYLTGFNNSESDIDLHIIFDNSDTDHLVRGNKIIDGTRIEYFEKPISDIYLTIENDYLNQNNSSFLIFGKSKIIYERDAQLRELQQYVNNKFKTPLPPLNDDEAKEQVAIINNRMEKLEKYAITDDPYFEHLYHLTIDKIRRFYHRLKGISYMETSKCLRLYKDKEYRATYYIDNLPEQIFIDMYFESLTNSELSKIQKYELLSKLYNYTKRNVTLNNKEYRIPIKSRNEDFDITIIKPTIIDKKDDSNIIPPTTLKIALKFIKEMGYANNEHCLGVIVYGSSLTGFNTKGSDIDLLIIFDDKEPNRLFRGTKTIDNNLVEYFERPLKDVYLEIENGYLNQNSAAFSIIGKGAIVFEKDDEMNELQQYALNRFSSKMPPLNLEEAKEQVSIIDNRMSKLEKAAIEDSPYFEHLYHLTIDKIRKFYHKNIGISKIPTSKVYRIYTDDGYRNSVYKENPDQEFVNMYISLITTDCVDKLEKFKMVKQFYDYATRNINLGEDYRILIKTRNTRINKNPDV